MANNEDSLSLYPSIFVIAMRLRGQTKWSVSGFNPILDRAKAVAKVKPYQDKHGAEFEYRVLEYRELDNFLVEETRPACPKCGDGEIALQIMSFGNLTCGKCKFHFMIKQPTDFAQFFTALPEATNEEK